MCGRFTIEHGDSEGGLCFDEPLDERRVGGDDVARLRQTTDNWQRSSERKQIDAASPTLATTGSNLSTTLLTDDTAAKLRSSESLIVSYDPTTNRIGELGGGMMVRTLWAVSGRTLSPASSVPPPPRTGISSVALDESQQTTPHAAFAPAQRSTSDQQQSPPLTSGATV